MGIDIRLPNISASSDAGQLAQIRSYLYQFAEQMQWALNTIEKGQSSEDIEVVNTGGTQVTSGTTESVAQSTFNSIKSLIIKSADIVNAYYDEIDKLIEKNGKYVAQSDFGTYAEETSMSITAATDGVTQNFNKISTITSEVDGIKSYISKNNSYIKSGQVGTTLDDENPENEDAAGIEIGDFRTLDDGVTQEVKERYARFTAFGLELFGSALTKPIAYIKQRKLYITEAEITGKLKIGGYEIDSSDGLVFKWVGR